MATHYTLAIVPDPKMEKPQCIYCGPSEEAAINVAQESEFPEVHIIVRPAVNRIVKGRGKPKKTKPKP